MDSRVARAPTVSATTPVVGRGPVATVYEVDGSAVKVFRDGFGPAGQAPEHRAIVAEIGRGTLPTQDDRVAAYVRSPLARRNLAAVVHDTSKRSWHEATILGVRLAGALQTAHEAGVVHGSVKPTNVLVLDLEDDATASAALSDFDHGGWRVAEAFPADLGYFAPELLEGTAPSRASDVYGLGATVLFALAGEAPFPLADGETLMRRLRRIMSEPVVDVRPLRVPDDLAAVVEKAMAKDPADRFDSAVAMGQALRDVQRSHGHTVTALDVGTSGDVDPIDVTTPDLGETPPPKSRSTATRTWVLGILVAVAALGAVAVVVLAVTSRPPRPGDSVAATNAPPTAASTPPTTATVTAAPSTGASSAQGLPKGADQSVFVDVPGYYLTDQATGSVVTDPAVAASIIQRTNVALVRTDDGRDVGAFVVLVLQDQVADDPAALAKIMEAVAPNPPTPPETTDLGGQPMIVTTTPDGLTAIAGQDPSGLIVGILKGRDRALMEQYLTALGGVAE